jgi:excisionase family DNA binding protein
MQAANFLGIGRSLTLKLINSGEIPSIRLGRRILIPIAGLKLMIAVQA